MAHVALAPQQHRPPARRRRLQGGARLAGVQRVDPRVGVEDGEQHRRVGCRPQRGVVRRVRQQPAELVGVVGGAVLVVPGAAEAEQLVAHHVEQRGAAHDRGVPLRAAGQRRPDQQAAVAAAADAELLVRRPAAGHERVGRRLEVFEHVVLVLAHPVAVPGLALLGAAAQPRDGVDAARLDPREDRGGVAGSHRDAEAAVAVEDRRTGGGRLPVRGQVGRAGQHEHPYGRAVRTGELDLPGRDRGHVDLAGGQGVYGHRSRAGVQVEHARRGDVVGPAEPELVPALDAPRQSPDRAESRQGHVPDRRAVGEVEQAQLAHRVAGSGDREQGPVEPEAVEHLVVLEHGLRVLGDELAPGLVRRRLGVGHAEATAGGVAVGEHVEPPVAAHGHARARVDPDLHGPQRRRLHR